MNTITIDPGLKGTGYAVWPSFQETVVGKKAIAPVLSGVIWLPKSFKGPLWIPRADWMVDQFIGVMLNLEDPVVFVCIEFVETQDSLVGQVSTKKGDLFKLAYLVGRLHERIRQAGCDEVLLLTASKWKGQLPKKVVHARLHKLLDQKFREHEADAVGIGLYLQGVF